MGIGSVIRQKRLHACMTQKELAEMVSLSQAAIAMYEQGEREPNSETLRALAVIFNCNVGDFYETDSNIEVIMGIKSNHISSEVSHRDETNAESQRVEGIRPIILKKFPMLGEIACGKPIFANEEHETYIDASADIKADFCLTARGDSMIDARIQDGDVVFIKQQPTVENGEIAAVVIDGEATLKKWFFYPDKQKLVLNPANQSYEPLVYVGSELDAITCLGKAVCFMSNL